MPGHAGMSLCPADQRGHRRARRRDASRVASILLAPLLVVAVALPAQAAAPAPAQAAAPAPAQAAAARVEAPVPAPPPAPIPAAAPDRTSLRLEATYDVTAWLTWSTGRIRVHTALHVRNTSGGPIEHLELNALPAKIGRMILDGVTVDGSDVQGRMTGQTILVPLGFTLGTGDATDVVVDYRAWFAKGTGGHLFLWSRANGIKSAYRWIPWISRRTAYEASWHGDPFVTPISPLVRVTLHSDVALRYATSGKVTEHHGNTWSYVARNVRDFNFTASRDYHVLTGRSDDGDTRIEVYTKTLDARVILRWAKRSMAWYEKKIGEYPYPTLTYGESSGGIGMESPAHIWLPYHFSSAVLPFLVGHETAHQWFYAVVGNDQTTNPFADEALAEVMDRSFFGAYRGSRCAHARLDLSMYDYSSNCYYEIIYVQGTNFLVNLREDMGSKAFWKALRTYWQDQRWKISSTRKLLETLRDYAGDWVLPRYHSRFPSLY
jgi:hypothetical protein